MKTSRRVPRPFLGLILPMLPAAVSAALLREVFDRGMEQSPAAIGVYALATLSLALLTVRLLRCVRAVRLRLRQTALWQRLADDPHRRALASARLSLAVTLCYCLAKAAAAVRLRCLWMGTLAAYFLVLCLLRCLLLRQLGSGAEGEAQRLRLRRLSGWTLLLWTAVLGAVVVLTVRDGRAIRYPGHLIYAAAFYCFYQLLSAAVALLRRRGGAEPTGRRLALATALVSLFFLQASMLQTFGDGAAWQQGMQLATGGLLLLVVSSMALAMIVAGRRVR